MDLGSSLNRLFKFTIQRAIIFMLLIPTVSSLIIVASYYSHIQKTRDEILFAEMAGRQRLLSEQIVNYVHMIHQLGQEEDRQGLQELVTTFENSLEIINTAEESLKKRLLASTDDFSRTVKELNKLWIEIKPELQVLITDPVGSERARQANKIINREIPRLWELSDTITTTFGQLSLQLKERLLWVISGVFLFNFFLLLMGIITIIRYLDERKKSEAALKASEEKLSAILEATPTVHYACRKEGDLWVPTYCSPNIKRLFGYDPEEIIGDGHWWWNNINPEEREKVGKMFNNVLTGGEAHYAHEYKFHMPDGNYIHLHDELTIIREPDGTPIEIVGTWMNVDERKKIEKELKESEKRYRELINIAPLGIAIHQEGKWVMVNQYTLKMLGYDQEEEMLGQSILNVVHPDYRELAAKRIKTMAKMGKPAAPAEEKILKKDGTAVVALITAAPIIYKGKPAFEVTAVDISDLKTAERALRESEVKFRTLFEESRDAIMFTTADGKFVDFNKAVEKLLGYEREELLNLPVEKMYAHADDRKRFIELIESQGFVENYKLQLRKKDGSIITCLDTASLRKDNDGKIIGYQGIVRDITTRVESENAIKKLSKVVENSPDVIFITDPDGVIEYVNPSFEKITGYSAQEAIGRKPNILKSGEMKAEFYEDFWKTISAGESAHIEIINRKKNGELFVYDQYVTPLTGKDGQIVNYISTGTDITERRKTEQELKASETRFRTLFEESQDAILITNPEGKFVDFNKAALELLGYTEEEMRELPVTELYVNKEDRDRYRSEIDSKGFLKDTELQFKKKDGTVIDIISSASVRRDSDGNIISYRAIIRDITERNKARLELKQALKKAQEGERVKTLFLANMSHEIRTPLNAILGYTELLEASAAHLVGEEEQVFFKAVRNNCNRLMGTVHEILDMSQIDSGSFETHLTEHNLVELLEVATGSFKIKAEQAGLEFSVRSTVKEAPIIADEYCVIQSISNVVENAIKYTPKGKVEVVLSASRSTYNVTVKDTGVGIEEGNIEEIFKEFKQESEGYTKQYQGVGLGLSLVKRYMDLCHAKIEVQSKKGVGTTFTLKFNKM